MSSVPLSKTSLLDRFQDTARRNAASGVRRAAVFLLVFVGAINATFCFGGAQVVLCVSAEHMRIELGGLNGCVACPIPVSERQPPGAVSAFDRADTEPSACVDVPLGNPSYTVKGKVSAPSSFSSGERPCHAAGNLRPDFTSPMFLLSPARMADCQPRAASPPVLRI